MTKFSEIQDRSFDKVEAFRIRDELNAARKNGARYSFAAVSPFHLKGAWSIKKEKAPAWHGANFH